MPVWHTSLSLWTPDCQQRLRAPGRLERAATSLLADVGDTTEWWIWNPHARIAHLRVALTPGEAAQLPPYCGPIDDAGPSGPPRKRRRPT